ncbi:GNAT family N-acetyltransferase [Streptomyces pacificus]|uniref:GNAT family N-acetyltransferase n=1 Tax=Streptomyces pacificus TaxID=2705029 RepID=A0A6A0B275_9ACTN|nr:GNAT family N-acetyltransferase [Streptomyces pacificus]GFH38404.1 GNAT family N-acetyltransferase [Streptomyces pacificus]
MSVTIRPYQVGDAQGIAELFNRHHDNPNPVAGGITAGEVVRELAERDTGAFLVAVDDGRVVGTFGLFNSTGRRAARAGELIADMFFVAPAYRNGVLTGRLFTEAVEWMMRSGCLVLRLTVNPANTVAFRLYRRVGCVSVGRTTPGEDGNVELHNYIPLVLRSVVADLGDEVRSALRGVTSFATLVDSPDGGLSSDVRLVDGARTVHYRLLLGDFRLTASVDVDRGTVRQAAVGRIGDGTVRPLRLTAPPYRVRAPRRAAPHRFTAGGAVCEVDGDDATVRVWHEGHHGPVFTSTWPGCRANGPSGWREGGPRDLRVVRVAGGLRITERCGEDEVVGTVTLDGGVLRQDFAFTTPPGRIFQTVGLRQGVFVHADGQRHPLGLGIGVRDASEVVAASEPVPAGGELVWLGTSTEIRIPVSGPARLVHSALLERGLERGADGVARLRTVLRPAAVPTAAARAPVRRTPRTGGPRRLELDAAAAGVTRWTEGTTKVLRSPHPRTRAFGCNPSWSAGMWMTREQHRFHRSAGLGWGVPSAAGWEEKHPLALYCPQARTGWEITAPADATEPLRVHVHTFRDEHEYADDHAEDHPEAAETVLWITPNTPRKTAVVLESGGRRWELAPTGFRQVWAAAAAVRLSDGSWLDCRPAPGSGGEQEIALRSTASGLLLGCVSPAGRGDTAWHLSVHDEPTV